jgi:MSHA biogenesis protein MshP
VSMDGGGLSDFTVSLECEIISDSDDVRICRLTATAQNGTVGSRPDYAYRRLSAEVVC